MNYAFSLTYHARTHCCLPHMEYDACGWEERLDAKQHRRTSGLPAFSTWSDGPP